MAPSFSHRDDKPESFGNVGDFWSRYDRLATKHDKDMLARMNGNLDVLLIFAGLFSAVNTAFIVVTIGNLSPSPQEETNHLLRLLLTQAGNATSLTPSQLSPPFKASRSAVRQNCVFFASLCSSLVTAAGAVMAKQWLGTYERTGQIGSLESQTLRRTEKFLGAEAWGLQPIVESLPAILLLSLVLFFIALADYFWVINRPVAYTILAFTAFGAFFYGFTVLAAARFRHCPYQTSVSRTLRWAGIWVNHLIFGNPLVKWIRRALSPRRWPIWEPISSAISQYRFIFWPKAHLRLVQSWTRLIDRFASILPTHQAAIVPRPHRDDVPDPNLQDSEDKERLYAQATACMLEVATEDDDLISVARNVVALKDDSALHLVAKSPFFTRLVHQMRDSLLAVEHRMDDSARAQKNALLAARAVAHVFAADPEQCYWPVWEALRHTTWSQEDSPDIYALRVGMWRVCLGRRGVAEGDSGQHFSKLKESKDLIQSRTRQAIAFMGNMRSPTSLEFVTLMTIACSSLNRYYLDEYVGSMPDGDAFFSLAWRTVRHEVRVKQEQEAHQHWDQIRDVWLARTGMRIRSEMRHTLDAHDQYLVSTDWEDRDLVQANAVLLRRYRKTHPNEAASLGIPLADPPKLDIDISQNSTSKLKSLTGGDGWEPMVTLLYHSEAPDTSRPDAGDDRKLWDVLIRCLCNISLLFHRFKEDPALATTKSIGPDERVVLRVYALQLLLCLDCEELVSRRLYFQDWRTATAVAEAFKLMDLPIVVEDSELFGVMQVLALIVKKLPKGDTKDLMECARPLIIRSMASEDEDTFVAAIQLLDGISCGLKWHRTRAPRHGAESPVVISSQLATSVIRNMNRLMVNERVGMEELRKSLHLLDWLIESTETDSSVASTLDEAGIGPLFAYCVRKSVSSDGNDDDSGLMLHRRGDVVEGSWQHVMLLLGLVYLETRVGDPGGQPLHSPNSRFSPTDCKAVAQYMRFFVQTRTKTDLSLRIIRLLLEKVFLFVEKAFQRRPTAATDADLDGASEAVIQSIVNLERPRDSGEAGNSQDDAVPNREDIQRACTTATEDGNWEEGHFNESEDGEDDLSDQMLRAQQSYANARWSSQHAAVTWWRSGGFRTNCPISYPAMLVL